MKTRAWIIVSLLALIIALPLSLRRATDTRSSSRADDRLVILTPHNESIRQEFGEAFARHWRATTGRSLHVDWRTPGGTSEIRMVLDAGFKAAEETGRSGIGVDLFFGGGEPDFAGQARKGRLLPLRIFETRPEWFSGENAPIPQTHTGERYYPEDKLWVGTCMSQFGICYNPDVLRRLKLPDPTAWEDLGDPRYRGAIALADPTKSGSVARTFELLVQGKSTARSPPNPTPARPPSTMAGTRAYGSSSAWQPTPAISLTAPPKSPSMSAKATPPPACALIFTAAPSPKNSPPAMAARGSCGSPRAAAPL
jgi:iron(III) transport system substrate-binding protein